MPRCLIPALLGGIIVMMPSSVASFGSSQKCMSHIHGQTRRVWKSNQSCSLNMVLQSETIVTNNIGIKERTILFQGVLAAAAVVTAAANNNKGLEMMHVHIHGIPVAESLLALASSVVVVSGATAAVEQMTASQVPAYDPSTHRFDQSTFGGRFYRMLLACDPHLLLYTEEEVRECRALSAKDNYKNVVDGSSDTDRKLWEAKRIADAALHPETGEWIPRPFRMSGYLPFNGPICVAMIASQSTFELLLWSWLNQSQNAMVNFHNRNSSSNMDNYGTLFKSYAAAVASALAVAFGLSSFVETHFFGEEAMEIMRFISFPSCIIASCLNCYIMRSTEIDSGVPLLNDRMEPVVLSLPNDDKGEIESNTSVEAAKRGVYSTTASRAVLQMPTFFIPPLIIDTVAPLKHYMCENPSMVVPITTFLLLVIFGAGLPCAVGVFPQMAKISVTDVESKYADLGYDEFYFNKGL